MKSYREPLRVLEEVLLDQELEPVFHSRWNLFVLEVRSDSFQNLGSDL